MANRNRLTSWPGASLGCMRFMFLPVLLFGMLAVPVRSHAAEWEVCRYEIRVTKIDFHENTISAVLEDPDGSLGEECPPVGQTLTFMPETLDYQSPLPRKKWPRVGQTRKLIYRHLDGVCKGDGNPHPCRIKHFSVN